MANRPTPEIDITATLVSALLAEQIPELAQAPLAIVGRGWDNTNWRVGDELIARLPHRAVAAPLIDHEQTWLPVLAKRLDMAIPAPVHAGRPSGALGYPWPWSLVPWYHGTEAAGVADTDSAANARRLANFFHQLHRPAPTDAPINPFRGGPLDQRREAFRARLATLTSRVDTKPLAQIFDQATEVGPSTEPVWLHGDLHPRNLVVADGALRAVVDWGDICSGDRATDLAVTYMLVPEHLSVVRELARADDATWTRARGWAAHFATTYLSTSDDDPVMASIGHDLLEVLTQLVE